MEQRKLLLDWLREMSPGTCKIFVQILAAFNYDAKLFKKLHVGTYEPTDQVKASVDKIFYWERTSAYFQDTLGPVDWNNVNENLVSYIRSHSPGTRANDYISPQTYHELLQSAYPYYLHHFID